MEKVPTFLGYFLLGFGASVIGHFTGVALGELFYKIWRFFRRRK